MSGDRLALRLPQIIGSGVRGGACDSGTVWNRVVTMDPVYLVILAASLSALFTAVPLGLVFAKGYGKLTEKVEEQPKRMRLEMKLEFKDGMDAHLDKYAHDEKEISTVRPRPPEILAG